MTNHPLKSHSLNPTDFLAVFVIWRQLTGLHSNAMNLGARAVIKFNFFIWQYIILQRYIRYDLQKVCTMLIQFHKFDLFVQISFSESLWALLHHIYIYIYICRPLCKRLSYKRVLCMWCCTFQPSGKYAFISPPDRAQQCLNQFTWIQGSNQCISTCTHYSIVPVYNISLLKLRRRCHMKVIFCISSVIRTITKYSYAILCVVNVDSVACHNCALAWSLTEVLLISQQWPECWRLYGTDMGCPAAT